MSRGGRRGGSSKRGPDMSWADYADDDDKDANTPPSNVPGPLFPKRNIRMPKPPSESEIDAANEYLSFRDRCRVGPLFAVLDKAQLLDSEGKSNKRAGFDPFNDQQRYSTRHFKKKRTVPDLTDKGRGDYGYTLRLFPQELWGVMDPKQRLPDWGTITKDSAAFASLGSGVKRKRERKEKILKFEERNDLAQRGSDYDNSDEDEDILDGDRRRTVKAVRSRRDDPSSKPSSEKKGLDAEDDYPDQDQDQNEEDAGDGEEELEDSEFDESDDGLGDDYNAEQYFDAGEDDEDGGIGRMDDDAAY